MIRTELWKLLRPGWKGTLLELGQHIRNMSGGMDPAMLGITGRQRAGEGLWMALSPRLLRSTVGLISEVRYGMLDPRGQEAIRTLLGLAGVLSLGYVVSGAAMGKSRDQILHGLNPLSGGDFLTHNVGGMTIGAGGVIRSMLQFLSGTISAVAPGGRPASDLIATNVYENPLGSFVTSRGATGPRMVGAVAEGATGGRVDVLPYENVGNLKEAAGYLGMAGVPFTAAGVAEGDPLWSVPFSFGGMNVRPTSPSRQRDEISQRMFDKPYRDLDYGDKKAVDEEAASLNERIAQQGRERGSEYQAARDKYDEDTADKKAEIETLSADALSGKRDVKEALERIGQLRGEMAAVYESVYKELEFEPPDPRLKPVYAAADRFFAIKPGTMTDPVTGLETTDWDTFFNERKKVRESLPPSKRAEFDSLIGKNLSPLEVKRNEASVIYDGAPQKYKGLDDTEGVITFGLRVDETQRRLENEYGRALLRDNVAFVLADKEGQQDAYKWWKKIQSGAIVPTTEYERWRNANRGKLEVFMPWLYDSRAERNIKPSLFGGPPSAPQPPSPPSPWDVQRNAQERKIIRDLLDNATTPFDLSKMPSLSR